MPRPTMPRDLPDEAKREWRRVVGELDDWGVLSPADRAVLIRYVVAWADWLEVDASIKASGPLVRDRNGILRRNPLTFVRREHAAELNRLGRELLLTPASRVSAGIELPQPDDALNPLQVFRAEREAQFQRLRATGLPRRLRLTTQR